MQRIMAYGLFIEPFISRAERNVSCAIHAIVFIEKNAFKNLSPGKLNI